MDMQRMPAKAQAPATSLAGVELFVENTPPTDKAPRTLYDVSWRVTWTNIPAVLADVAAKLDEWGINEAKPVVLRNDGRVPQEVIDMLLDYIVLTVKNNNIDSHIAVTAREVNAQVVRGVPSDAKQVEVLSTEVANAGQA